MKNLSGPRALGRPLLPAALTALAVLLPAHVPLRLDAATNEMSARDLVASVSNARRTSGFRMRATLTRSNAEGARDVSRQITVRGRFEGDSARILYLCTSPPMPDGQAVLVEKTAGAGPGISVFIPPDRMEQVPEDMFDRPFFGTDFTLADMAEPFWAWPVTRAGGETNLLGHAAVSLEFRSPASDAASHPSVRTWIAPDILLPLLIEKLDSGGAVIRRLHSEKLTNRAGGAWAPMLVIAEDPASGSRTTLAVRGGERDIDVPAGDFTPAGIASLLARGERKDAAADAPLPPPPAEGEEQPGSVQ